jgi:DNA-binding response OmpR family regulator
MLNKMNQSKKIILITEDEPPMSRILTDALSESGFETLQAKDGQEGLTLALEKHPDLILLDVLMPKMDGLAMIRKLRADSWGKNVPVIVLTNVSSDTDEIISTVVDTQPAYYFIKSDVKLDTIVEKIKQILTPAT